MPWTYVETAYGPPAHEALANAVEQAKRHDALAPVTAVVPNNTTGLAARRWLARRCIGGRSGTTSIRFVTPYGIAELLGSRTIAESQKRPVTRPVIAAAVRTALRHRPSYFAGVQKHPSTESSLVEAHRELCELDEPTLERLQKASHGARGIVRVHQAVKRALDGKFSNEQSLVAAAVRALKDPDSARRAAAAIGELVVFCPERLTATESRLLTAVASHVETTVIAALTGNESADEPVKKAVARLRARIGPPDRRRNVRANSSRCQYAAKRDADKVKVLSVSDADEEVRHAVRAVVAAAHSGTPLHRCAIAYGASEPYARLVGDALDGAGIEWVGNTADSAETSVLGGALLAMLDLLNNDYPRRDVMAWLASAPILVDDIDGRRSMAPSSVWERIAREAGLTGGLTQWQERLERHADDLERRSSEAIEQGNESRSSWLSRQATEARQLQSFIEALDEDLSASAEISSWLELSEWCSGLLRRYLPHTRHRQASGWPPSELRFATAVTDSINRLAYLDEVDNRPSLDAFRRSLQMELEATTGRHGKFGHGVIVGLPSAAVGAEIDLLVVCGLAEGTFPARLQDDPLLPDRERRTVAPDLALRADRTAEDHRALLALLSAAREVLALYPRGNLRRSTYRAPSRWLLDIVEQQSGSRPSTEGLGKLREDWFCEVPSFVASLRSADPHPKKPNEAEDAEDSEANESATPAGVATKQEYDTRELLVWHEHGNLVSESPLLQQRQELQRGVELIEARSSNDFTRFDGNLSAFDAKLGGAQFPHPLDGDHITSPTRLEGWAKCPHAYFVRHILGVRALEDPDDSYRMAPQVKGSLIHDILERWLNEAISSRQVPAPDEAWSDRQRKRLASIAQEECDRFAASGLVGRPLYWDHERREILSDLNRMLDFDKRKRSEHSSRPVAAEAAFAMFGSSKPDSLDRANPIVVELTNHVTDCNESEFEEPLTVRLRGSIDRIDETRSNTATGVSGRGLVVIDYKTGSTRRYKKLDADQPTPEGGHLQLVLYAAAAREMLQRGRTHRGRITGDVHGEYWFVTQKGGFQSLGYQIDSIVRDKVLATVRAISEGIRDGVFPMRPSKPGWRLFVPCYYCEPDGMGTGDAWRDWQRKRESPDVWPYTGIVEPDLVAALRESDVEESKKPARPAHAVSSLGGSR